MLNKKLKIKLTSIFLALTMSLNFVGFFNNKFVEVSSSDIQKLAQVSSFSNQVKYMMDGNNFLKFGFYMNAAVADATEAGMQNVTLTFQIPGYDPKNLKVFLLDKNPNHDFETTEYTLSTSTLNPTPTVYITDLKESNYEVHVYNGSLATENFVCKAEFCADIIGTTDTSSGSLDLLYGSGEPILGADDKALQMHYITPTENKNDLFAVMLPIELVPFYANTIKVAFFATDRKDDEPPNINNVLYEYAAYESSFAPDGGTAYKVLFFAPDAQWGTAETTSYEAHFYIDEVKEGNFLCKAVGIKNAAAP